MKEVSDRLMDEALSLLTKYPPGSELVDPVSTLQEYLQIGHVCALVLAKRLGTQGIWSPLVDGKRFIARDLWLYLPDDFDVRAMPPRIEFIDAISRMKQRAVLCLIFAECEPEAETPKHFEDLPVRKQITNWLDTQSIAWEPCGAIADPAHPTGYAGRIYIDVPPDESNPQYQKLQRYLEDETGQCRFPSVIFCSLSLALAMENALFDEPGYYDACLAYLFAPRRSP